MRTLRPSPVRLRCGLRFSVALTVILAGCSSPVGTPQVGGQTGDPGVVDHTSIVKVSGQRASGAFPCWPPTSASDGSGALGLDHAKLLPLDGSTLVVMDALRGLQFIDVSDPSGPRRVGMYSLLGIPVDMHAEGSRVIVALHGSPYWGSLNAVHDRQDHSQVLVIDAADPSNPRLVTQTDVPGFIAISHMVKHGDRALLSVLSNEFGPLEYPSFDGERVSTVRTFDVSGETITQLDQLPLGTKTDFATGVQTHEQTLVVARAGQTVSLVDLSAADGTLRESTSAPTTMVPLSSCSPYSPQPVDLRDGVLRVVQGQRLAAFDAHDASVLKPLGSCEIPFLAGSDISDPERDGRAEFVGAWAFVTPPPGLAVDTSEPFTTLALSFDPTGQCKNATLATLPNSVFRGAFDAKVALQLADRIDERGMVGDGVSVRLYDATKLGMASVPLATAVVDPGPDIALFQRESVVLERAIRATAADGTVETALLAIPGDGFAPDGSAFEVVQLVTLSDHTLTVRGLIKPATRLLALPGGLVATWSQSGLAVSDLSSPDAPATTPALELSPRFAQVIDLGSVIARKRTPITLLDALDPLGTAAIVIRGPQPHNLRPTSPSADVAVELVPKSADPEVGSPLASIVVAASSTLARTDDLLVSVRSSASTDTICCTTADTERHTVFEVFDAKDAHEPRHVGSLSTAYPGIADCRYCDAQHSTTGVAQPCFCSEGNVKPIAIPHGMVVPIFGRPRDYTRRPQLRLPTGEPDTTPPPAELTGFRIIDLSDPTHPATRVVDVAGGTASGLFAHASTLHYSYSVSTDGNVALTTDAPVPAPDAPRNYYRKIDLSDLSAPVVGPEISVPGRLIAVDATERLYVAAAMDQPGRDPLAVVHRLWSNDRRAVIEATRELGEHGVNQARVDGQGHLLVEVMGPAWQPNVYHWVDGPGDWGPATRLSILDADTLRVVGELEVDGWSLLRAVSDQRAVYDGPGGVLVVDLNDASTLKLQAYHPAWSGFSSEDSSLIFDGHEIVARANGGLARFDATVTNLP